MYQYFWMFLFIFGVSSFVGASPGDQNIKGVACFVSDDLGRVLITRDILTNKIAIPGGYIDEDDPKEAAKRETFEETGMAVEVLGELERRGSAVVFACRAISPIPTLNATSFSRVFSWTAPHFGREVRGVYMISPHLIGLSETRFPEQAKLFSNWLKEVKPSQAQVFENFEEKASFFLVFQAEINRGFQETIKALPESLSFIFDFLLKYVSVFGSGALIFVLLPFAMASGGLKRASAFLFSVILMTLLVSFLKLSTGEPRPFYIYPELALGDASGFSFPSGHTATAMLLWGWVYFWLKQAGKSFLLGWGLIVTLVALSRVYLGVHYLGDVLVGALVGGAVFVVSCIIDKKIGGLSPRLWAGMGLAAVPLAVTQVYPVFAFCSLFSLFFALFLWVFQSKIAQGHLKWNKGIFVVTFLVTFGVMGFVYCLTQMMTSSLSILLSYSLCTFFLPFGLCLISGHFKKEA